MLEKARKKLLDEIGKDNGYKKIIGDFLLQQLDANPGSADMILKGNKSIKGAMEAMKAEARKIQKDGCGVLTDDEGFAIVLEYFDIPMARVTKPILQVVKPTVAETTKFDVNLEDLLNG
ncbi:MAG: hypothetical protein K0S75_843 [Clostridia bacterium]|jgi:hypothetical protein|nr:hypothetical protein [Clostridia bacterium]